LQANSSQVEDFAVATLDFCGGQVARLACSWKLPVGCDAIISASFYGCEGTLSFHNVNGSFYYFEAEQFVGTTRTTLCGPPDDWAGRAALAWVRQLGSNPGFDPEVGHALEVAAVLDAIYSKRMAAIPRKEVSSISEVIRNESNAAQRG